MQRPSEVTGDDLRGLRRWVIVAGVWAVAATAVALIALLDTSDSQAEKDADALRTRLAKVERTLGGRLDALDKRLDELPKSGDVSHIEDRLVRAERSVSQARSDAKDAKAASDDLGALEDRVKALEEDATKDSADQQP